MSARIHAALVELHHAVAEEVAQIPLDNAAPLHVVMAKARADARLALQEVADRAGITKSHAWEIEQGRARNPTVATVAGLSKALGVPFLWLANAALSTVREAQTPERSATAPAPTPPNTQDA